MDEKLTPKNLQGAKTTLFASDGSSKIYTLQINDKTTQIASSINIHETPPGEFGKPVDGDIDNINDITIAKFSNKNYVFFNRFHTSDIYMASLESG